MSKVSLHLRVKNPLTRHIMQTVRKNYFAWQKINTCFHVEKKDEERLRYAANADKRKIVRKLRYASQASKEKEAPNLRYGAEASKEKEARNLRYVAEASKGKRGSQSEIRG